MSVLLRIVICYLIASLAVTMAMVSVTPDGHVPSTIALLFFPIIPFLFGGDVLVLAMHRPQTGLLSTPYFWRSLGYCTLFVIFFVGTWYGAGRWFSEKLRWPRFKNRRMTEWESKDQLLVDEGRDVSSAHLLNPKYIVDFAKENVMGIDDVHASIRDGKLSSYWHKGVLFVGSRKPRNEA